MPKDELDTFQKAGGKRVLVVPYDYRVPKVRNNSMTYVLFSYIHLFLSKVRIVTAQARKLSGERIVVRIDNWPVNSAYPNGHFVRSLGAIGDLETEMDGILVENDISITPFSKGMLAEMPVGGQGCNSIDILGMSTNLSPNHVWKYWNLSLNPTLYLTLNSKCLLNCTLGMEAGPGRGGAQEGLEKEPPRHEHRSQR